MKTCTICKQGKDLSEYNKHSGRKDGLQAQCRECSHKHFKNYYENNREKQFAVVAARNKKLIHRNREWLAEYLSTHPCVDCSNSDIRVLEFDHLEHKIMGVGKMVRHGSSIQKIQKEIDKCEIRCRNCHQIKTMERRGGAWQDEFFKTI